MSQPKILVLDLESSPNVADVWSLWNTNVSLAQLRESGQVIGVGAKWYGAKKVEFFSDFHGGHDNMVSRTWELIDQADAVIHYNGTTFDMPYLNSEFLKAGLTPPSPYQQIDLLKTVKRVFRFPSNKLQYVSTFVGLSGKMPHEGHSLWVKCMAGDPKAWSTMRAYCRQDVVTTEQLYDALLPWLNPHPHLGLYLADGEDHCAKCMSTDLEKRGYAFTALSKYQQYRCRQCGAWSRGAKALDRLDIRPVS